jgi:hypothetical protein
MPSGAATPAAHKALVNIAHALKKLTRVSTGGAAGARGGVAITDCGFNPFARSVAAADTTSQPASDNCAVKTRRSDRRGKAGASNSVEDEHRNKKRKMISSAGKAGRAIGAQATSRRWACAACAVV